MVTPTTYPWKLIQYSILNGEFDITKSALYLENIQIYWLVTLYFAAAVKRYSLAYRGRKRKKNASGSAVPVKMVINESYKLHHAVAENIYPIKCTHFCLSSNWYWWWWYRFWSGKQQSVLWLCAFTGCQKKSRKQWETVRSPVLKAVVEGCAIRAEAYCKDCGSLGIYCISCIKLLHTKLTLHTHFLLGR